MASKLHLSIIKRGVASWNKWRKKNPTITPNLSRAKLTCADLDGVNFSGTNLRGAMLNRTRLLDGDFSSAMLQGADLSDSNLARATFAESNMNGARVIGCNFGLTDLRAADLTKASLQGSDLIYSDLRLANLSNASLSRTSFHLIDFIETNLRNARMTNTVFDHCDLSKAKGLSQIKHDGPSVVDLSTIQNSEGKIPEIFLRGVGFSDTFITYAQSLVSQPIHFYSCFISYSSRDNSFVQRLYADLQSNGVRCWFAPVDMRIGEELRDGIDESIRVHDKLLLVLSRNSVESGWVKKEVESAFEQERKQKRRILFPIRLDNAVMKIDTGWPADIKRTRHVGDFRRWKEHDSYREAFDRLMRDLAVQEEAD